MATEAARFPGRPLDDQRQLQNRLDTNRPSHGRTWQTEHKVGRIIRALLPRTPIILVNLYGETLAFLDLKALGISVLFSEPDPLDSASTHRP